MGIHYNLFSEVHKDIITIQAIKQRLKHTCTKCTNDEHVHNHVYLPETTHVNSAKREGSAKHTLDIGNSAILFIFIPLLLFSGTLSEQGSPRRTNFKKWKHKLAC